MSPQYEEKRVLQMKKFYVFGICCSLTGFVIAVFMLVKPYWEWQGGDSVRFVPFISTLFIINLVLFIQYLVIWSDKARRTRMLTYAFGSNCLYWLGILSPLLIQCAKVLFLK